MIVEQETKSIPITSDKLKELISMLGLDSLTTRISIDIVPNEPVRVYSEKLMSDNEKQALLEMIQNRLKVPAPTTDKVKSRAAAIVEGWAEWKQKLAETVLRPSPR